ncbi:hypothetical protein HYX05_03760 [Candidatus Woesearchaeota archaeon]|nr:hypothetical protein [Candidatus Woesearchaeota archaeon]
MRGIIFLLLVFLTTSLQAKAISVVSDYLVNDTLELIEGTSKIYSIRLQNPSDYEAAIRLDYDDTLMKVIDYREVYNLAPKDTAYRILFNVTAPDKLGIYRASYTVSEVEPAGGGAVPIRLKINRGFYIKVTEDPNKFHIDYDYAAYIAVALVFLLYVFWKKNKARKGIRKFKKFL